MKLDGLVDLFLSVKHFLFDWQKYTKAGREARWILKSPKKLVSLSLNVCVKEFHIRGKTHHCGLFIYIMTMMTMKREAGWSMTIKR